LIKNLARIKKGEAEEAYLMNQATLLYDAWKADNGDKISLSGLQSGFPSSIYFYSDLAAVYFHLNQRELCQLHYHNYFDKLNCENEEDKTQALDYFRKMGLELNSLEDLQSHDPFEIIKLSLEKR